MGKESFAEWANRLGYTDPAMRMAARMGYEHALSAVPAPPEPINHSNLFKWCHPGDSQEQRWLLMFDDRDRGYNLYEVEADAIEGFNSAEDRGWNCHLFTSVPRITPTLPDSIPVWMGLKMVKVAMEDHNFLATDNYYAKRVMKRVKKYAETDRLDADSTPPEVEPVAWRWHFKKDGNRVQWCYTDRERTGDHIIAEPLYTSSPSPKPKWDADDNPMNLEAAARQAELAMSILTKYVTLFADERDLYMSALNNLRKFLPEGK